MTKTEKKIKDRVSALSEAAAKRLIVKIATSFINGAAQQNSEDIAEFVRSDLRSVFKNLDDLVQEMEDENTKKMFG